jgi:hypothetical protein
MGAKMGGNPFVSYVCDVNESEKNPRPGTTELLVVPNKKR